jgi:hypothetical protein
MSSRPASGDRVSSTRASAPDGKAGRHHGLGAEAVGRARGGQGAEQRAAVEHGEKDSEPLALKPARSMISGSQVLSE